MKEVIAGGTPNPKIEFHDPAVDFHVHPLRKSIPVWSDSDARLGTMADSVKEDGIIEPLKITKGKAIVDGVMRWRAAKRMQLSEVPCVIVPDEDVPGIILQTLVQRRHCTKSQLAYLTFPIMQAGFVASRDKRHQNLRKGQQTPDSAANALSGKTAADFAESIGICRHLFFDAQKVHELFETHREKRDLTDQDDVTERNVTFREFYEKRILRPDDPYGLGAVVAGIGSSLKNNGKARPPVSSQLNLFTGGLDTAAHRFTYWPKFNDEEKRAGKDAVAALIAQLPEETIPTAEAALRERKKKMRGAE